MNTPSLVSSVPILPDTAPFTSEQRAWLNGYFAGLFSRGAVDPAVTSVARGEPATAALTPLTILFGSQTGTAELLARRAAKEAGKRGFAAMALDMAQTDAAKLSADQNVLIIASTYGDGEAPDNAKALHAALAVASAPSLSNLRFSVCSLGDASYVQFCKCGQDFDAFLEKRGAARVAPRADCDVDYEMKFAAWLNTALSALKTVTSSATPASRAIPSETPTKQVANETGFSRSRPFSAVVLTSRKLSGAGSAKHVYHVEFALGNSGLGYEPGDALAVLPHNCPELVGEILGALGCDGEEAVPAPDGSTTSLRHALTELYEIGRPSPALFDHIGISSGGATTATRYHVIDLLLARADVKFAPVEFVRTLRKLQPRLYSLSSSPKAHAGQVHLTVGAVRYEAGARIRKGVCSTFLGERVVPGETRVGIYVHSNKTFRPPAKNETPMIMVGPGTGIAPFRGFLHERRVTGATGRNWLFFGDQKSATDFLYADEMMALKKEGVLTRLDLAWSRDQAEKVYVQNRLLEHAAEVYAWLEAGAHFYVCGDAACMAKDVDIALHTLIERAGHKTPEAAADYVQALRAARRYARDVY